MCHFSHILYLVNHYSMRTKVSLYDARYYPIPACVLCCFSENQHHNIFSAIHNTRSLVSHSA